MVYSNVKKEAEDLERRAKIVSERTRQKERFSHLPYEELKELRKRSFDRYRQAGDMWAKAGVPRKAAEMYQGASRFAPSEQVVEKLEEKIRMLYGNGKRLERSLFSLIAIISLIGALFFTSLNLSGYATGTLTSDVSLIGIVLFVLGLVFTFLFFRSKKK